MAKKELLIPARITQPVFEEFAVFDAMGRQKRWRSPLLFALIMSAISVVCYTQAQRLRGAWLLGTVLLAVGLGIPGAYLVSFFLSVRAQGKRMGRENAPIAYTVRLREEGVLAENGKERVELTWEQVPEAYRLQNSVCLYVSPRQAYVLPTETEKSAQEIWDWVCTYIPEERRKDRRK